MDMIFSGPWRSKLFRELYEFDVANRRIAPVKAQS
jgi:hypothetical protein